MATRAPLKKGLHLKSACTVLDDQTIIFDPEVIKPEDFETPGLTFIPTVEKVGANVLAIGKDLIVSGDAPRTAAMLKGMGWRVHTVKVTEFHKGDGALTCLSIRIPAENSWSA